MISPLDQDHNIGNFISEVRALTERFEQLERIANFLDQNDNLTVPRGVTLQSGALNLGEAVPVTISGGVITRTTSYHAVDTEGGAALDNLDTINGGAEGDMLIVRAYDSARTVRLRDGVGNLALAVQRDLDHAQDRIMLIFDGTDWCEISFSSNA